MEKETKEVRSGAKNGWSLLTRQKQKSMRRVRWLDQ